MSLVRVARYAFRWATGRRDGRLRVGIVGAGICGLAAGRYLHRSDHQVVVFERNAWVGGRVATYREDGFIWDTGATSFAPRGKGMEPVLLHELDDTGLVKIEKPIYMHEGLRVRPGARVGSVRYAYVEGNDAFPRRLSADLDVRLSAPVDEIEASSGVYRLRGEAFDAVILALPVPQASRLLWTIGENRAKASVHYRPCLSVLLGYQAAPPPTNYHALLDPEQVHPLTWLSLESVKVPGRAPEGASAMTAQLSAAYSRDQFERPDTDLIRQVSGYIAWLYGPVFASPVHAHVVRWKYSRPESVANFDHLNRRDAKLLIASDGLLGGHVEDAFEIGTRAARLLVEEG